MAEPKNKTLAAIPQRSEIPDKYKWNLADIYKAEADWEADYRKVQQLVAKAAPFKGRLASSAAVLFEALETRTQISLISSNLFQYAKLNRDLDGRVSKSQAMTERANMLMAEATAAFSFIEPELLKLSDDEIKKLADRFEKKDIYDFYIKELIRSREHIRSEEVEELLAMTMPMAGGPENIFSLLDDSDLKYAVHQRRVRQRGPADQTAVRQVSGIIGPTGSARRQRRPGLRLQGPSQHDRGHSGH